MMIERSHDGLPLFHFQSLDGIDELACAVSTRRGPGDMEFNLGPVRGPDRGARAANWRRFAEALRMPAVWPQLQVHEPGVVEVTGAPSGFNDVPPADACFTSRRGLGLLAFSADCPLVAIYVPGRGVGVAHASWRCTTGLIVSRLIERMLDPLGCEAAEMHACISPSAGPCCYEVGQDVYEAAAALPDRDACFTRHGDRRRLDLWEAARQQLRSAGVPANHIETGGICTLCTNETFYSYRKEGRATGQFGLMIGLR